MKIIRVKLITPDNCDIKELLLKWFDQMKYSAEEVQIANWSGNEPIFFWKLSDKKGVL